MGVGLHCVLDVDTVPCGYYDYRKWTYNIYSNVASIVAVNSGRLDWFTWKVINQIGGFHFNQGLSHIMHVSYIHTHTHTHICLLDIVNAVLF